MIAQLTGTVAAVEANSVVLDVNGVGYRAFVPVSVLASVGSEGATATLYTTMVVREDDITLFGFRTRFEQQIFGALTSVSGVGPKVALSLLSVLDATELARALASNDAKSITKVPGVGPKLAQRLILELGERMAALSFEQRVAEAEPGSRPSVDAAAADDVVEALVNLQYSRADAKRAAERVLSAATDTADVPALIRAALNLLSGAGRR